VAAKWREEYNAPNVTVEYVICDGCLASDAGWAATGLECEIRACGVARGVANCAHCDDYACEKLEGFLGFVRPPAPPWMHPAEPGALIGGRSNLDLLGCQKACLLDSGRLSVIRASSGDPIYNICHGSRWHYLLSAEEGCRKAVLLRMSRSEFVCNDMQAWR